MNGDRYLNYRVVTPPAGALPLHPRSLSLLKTPAEAPKPEGGTIG